MQIVAETKWSKVGTDQNFREVVRVVRVLDQVCGGDGAGIHQLGGDEDGGRGDQLELTLLDTELTEEPVHDITREKEHIGMAVLVETNLEQVWIL